MIYTKFFKDLGKFDAPIAGGKGASLGEMTQAGIPVPGGYVVLSETFEKFIHATDLAQEIDAILDKVDHKAIHTIDQASEDIRALILSREMPDEIKTEIMESFAELNAEFVAVRSSATAEDGTDHAWAGQLESYLNVTHDDVLEKVQHCWSSLFTPRAIFYRFEKGLHTTKISVAVVVQKMVNSEKSGIAFSVHPVTEDRNQIIIEAGYGLGEAIVSGSVTPDSYVIEKEPRRIIDVSVNHQNRAMYRKGNNGNEWIDLDDAKASSQVLDEPEILELSTIIMRIENHYGFPCDIEWAYELGEFFIVQSRPITTLSNVDQFDPGEHYNSFKDGVLKLGVYPNLYPLDCENWHNQNHNDKFFELFGVQKGTMQYFEIVPEGVIDYVLAPKRQPARLFNAAEEYKQKHGLDSFQKLHETFYPKRADLEKKVDEHFKGKNFSEFSKGERLELFNLRFEYLWNVLPYDLYGYISTDIWQAKLYEILEKKIPSGKESEEFNTVLTALIQPEVPSSSFFEYLDVIDAAIKISEGTSEINNESQKLAETWGHIPVFCYGDRWGADHYSSEINDTLKEHTLPELKEKLEEGKQHKKHRAETIKKYNDQYNFTKEELQYFIDFGLVSLTKDEAEIFNGYVSHYAPALYKLMAQDLGLDEIDFKYLYIKEVNQAFTDSTFDYKSVIQKRKTVNSIEEPNEDFSEKFFVYDNESHDILNFLNQKLVTLNSSASCAYPGIVTGAIKIINSVSDIGKVNQGDIMVCQATTVDYLLGMKKAGAIVTEFGGLTCHAAVVAREFKTPCVVGMKDARSMFSEGTIVTVNASACTVTSSNDETLKKKNSVISSKLLQDLNILNKDAWVEDGRWIQPPLIWGMFTHWSQGEIVKRIAPGCDLGTIFTIDGFAYHQIKTFNELNKYLEQLYKENALKDLALKIDIEGSYILAEIMNELKASDEDIMADFESLFKKYMDFIGFWTATTIIGNQISPLAKKMGYVETEADLFEKVHPYLRESWIEEEVATMRKIAELFVKKYGETANISSSIDSDVELKNTIDAYLKKYSWARISKWIGEPIDRTYAEKRLAEEINNVIHKNYIEKIHQGSLDDSDGLVAVSVQSAYYRAQATMMEMMMAERMHSVFSVIAQKNSLEYADMLLLTPQELIQVVNDPNHEIKDKNVILERKNPFFCVIDTDGTEIILTTKDKDYSIVYDLYVNSHDSGHSNELKGIGASKGKVTALVRIISSAKEFGTFKEGEVLVTVETSPTFVPLMRMASAILTARGGITSHAAIVSRELGKPCIIAIKDVTKILNDGDLIEVDADNGVVRILKKDATDSFPINPNDYDFIGLWRDDLFAAYFWTRWFDSEKTKALGFNEITFGGTFIINGGNFFWHKEMRAGQKTILDRAITTKDGAIFGNLRTHAEKTFLRVMQETDKLAVQDPNPENFKIFIGLARELMYYWTFGASIAADVDEYIISFAQKEHIPAEDVAHYVPTPETELIRQQQDVRRLHLVLKDRGWLSRLIDDKVSVIKDIQEDVELFAQLQAHVEKIRMDRNA
jgi:phosphoenolpyruvate synthase/pyruvate phosphate dikinase